MKKHETETRNGTKMPHGSAGQFDLIACLNGASRQPGPPRDALFQSALNDPPEVFQEKFERSVKSLMGFSIAIPRRGAKP